MEYCIENYFFLKVRVKSSAEKISSCNYCLKSLLGSLSEQYVAVMDSDGSPCGL